MQTLIFYPLLAMVGLSILVWLQMYHVRIGTALREKIPAEAIRMTNPDLPQAIVSSGDNWRNVFEAPTLFYVFCLSVFVTQLVDSVFLWGAWLYVGLRGLHSLIHLSYNRVMHRFLVYVVSCLLLWALWARFAIQLIQAGS